jgi:predicted RNA-binding protein with PIN domain
MQSFPTDLLQLLLPAIDAGRRALRDLEQAEIPAALQRVAATTGGKLPPPLARSLLEHLDEDSWLREQAIAAWPGLDVDAGSIPVRVSSLFLSRPGGWWITTATNLAEVRAADERRRLDDATSALEAARAENAEARRRDRKTRDDARRSVRDAQEQVSAVRAQLAADREDERRTRERLEGTIASLEADVARLTIEAASAEETAASARRTAAAVRKERNEERSRTSATTSWLPAEPMERARYLDRIAAAARRLPDETPESGAAAESLELPPGLRPDDEEAIVWLLRQDLPCVLLVDGYNLIHHLDVPDAGRGRTRVITALDRIRRAAAAPVRPIAVFDSGVSAENSVRGTSGGVEVRFTREGHTADDEIAALVEAGTGNTVVVSSDREVREHAEARGALGLWSEAMAAWLRGRA